MNKSTLRFGRALPLVLPALVVMLACKGKDDEPVRDAENHLTALKVTSKTGLPLDFQADRLTYTVKTASDKQVVVQPTVLSTLSKVYVNGTLVASGANSAPVDLLAGPKAIEVKVVAESGAERVYTINASLEGTTPVKVSVQGSVGGEARKAAKLAVVDGSSALESGIPVAEDGTATLYLNPAKAYELKAMEDGRASSLISGFKPSLNAEAWHYCMMNNMKTFPAEAPLVEEIAVGPDANNGPWAKVVNGRVEATSTAMRYVKVSFLGRSAVDSASWAGPGIIAAIDRPASYYHYFAPLGFYTIGEPAQVGGTAYYRTTAVFDLARYSTLTTGQARTLNLSAYDVASNRTSVSVQLVPTDVTSGATDADISALKPVLASCQSNSFGVTQEWFSMPVPAGQQGASGRILVAMGVKNGASVVNVRGMEYYRSEDAGKTWKRIGIVNYAAPSDAAKSSFWDMDPALVPGKLYQYRTRAFTANTAGAGAGYSQYSDPVENALAKPFVTALASPAANAVVTTTTPSFTFSISDPTILDPASADTFTFLFAIKEKGGSGHSLLRARYDLIAQKWLYRTSDSAAWSDAPAALNLAFNADKSQVSFSPGFYLTPGKAYEWTIAGLYDAAGDPVFTRTVYTWKYRTADLLVSTVGYGSTSTYSNASPDGYFSLVIDPSAK